MEISYDLLEKEIFDLLGDKRVMVLATCSENRVTARNVSCLVINKKIYFQTDKNLMKCNQILKNPNVALCVDNIQIEGVAKVKKHTLDEENKEFINMYKKHYKGSYDLYSHMKNEVVIEVEPILVTLWKYESGQPFRDFLDIVKKKACRECYDTSI